MKRIIVLLSFAIGGFFMLFVPSPIDIGESILVNLGNNCQTEQCIQTSNNLLNSYHIGGLIIGVGSVLVIVKSIVRPS